jgi:hypothetical protein
MPDVVQGQKGLSPAFAVLLATVAKAREQTNDWLPTGLGRKILVPTTRSTRMDTSDQITCLDPYLASFEESLSSKNYKPWTLKNYGCLLRRFGRLVEAEGVAPWALTPDLAVELGRRLPTTPKSQIKIHSLAKRFVEHLIEIGVVAQPPLTAAQAERAELPAGFETYLIRQRGLSPRSIYHVLRFADRFLDHRFGDSMLDLPAPNARDVVAFMEHLLARKRPFRDKTPATHLRSFFQYLFGQGLTTTNLSLSDAVRHPLEERGFGFFRTNRACQNEAAATAPRDTRHLQIWMLPPPS